MDGCPTPLPRPRRPEGGHDRVSTTGPCRPVPPELLVRVVWCKRAPGSGRWCAPEMLRPRRGRSVISSTVTARSRPGRRATRHASGADHARLTVASGFTGDAHTAADLRRSSTSLAASVHSPRQAPSHAFKVCRCRGVSGRSWLRLTSERAPSHPAQPVAPVRSRRQCRYDAKRRRHRYSGPSDSGLARGTAQ